MPSVRSKRGPVLSLVATMLVLQQLGLDFGFDIWPMGEFRNWIEFLQDRNGFNAAKLFWTLDNRNALSPWWFIAARPLIDATSAAPLILHLLSGLFVGIAAYLLMAELTQSRCLALSVGSLIRTLHSKCLPIKCNMEFRRRTGFR